MRFRSKGFTLVEVLIVVVIIAILAALTVPRMIAQVNKAKAAEALQMIGSIKRAAERYRDLTGDYPNTSLGSYMNEAPYGNWALLGLKSFTSKNFNYYYNYLPEEDGGPGFITVAYFGEGDGENTIYHDIEYSVDAAGGQWWCEGVFKYVNESDPSKGCKV